MATNLKKFTITDSNNTTHDVQVQSAIEDSAGNKISDIYTKKADLEETQLGYTTRETHGRTIVNVFHPEASVDPTDGKNISFNKVAWSGNYSDLTDVPHLFKYVMRLSYIHPEGAYQEFFWFDYFTNQDIDIEDIDEYIEIDMDNQIGTVGWYEISGDVEPYCGAVRIKRISLEETEGWNDIVFQVPLVDAETRMSSPYRSYWRWGGGGCEFSGHFETTGGSPRGNSWTFKAIPISKQTIF